MKKYYQVFKIDTSFRDYEADYKYAGAESKEDLIQHIREIFPDDVDIVTEGDLEDYPDKELGDEIRFPWFSDKQFKDICTQKYRIERIKNLYTDKPYTVIDSFGYIE